MSISLYLSDSARDDGRLRITGTREMRETCWLDAYKAYVVKREVRQEVLTEQLKTKSLLVLEKEIYLGELVKVSEVLKHVASETQGHLKLHIDNIVSLALDSVFPDEFTFALNFVDKRGTIEADICLLKDGRESDPMDSEGGGVIDILSFSLRIAIWSLKKTSPVIILDEYGYIVRKQEQQDSRALTFEEAAQYVEGNLRMKKSEDLYKAWMKRLRDDSYVKIYEFPNR
jgi:hypothetical protein